MTLSLVQKEYKVLDIMKFVMAIIVVAIHSHPDLVFSSSFVRQIFEGIYSIAVPYFFMASGFLLFKKIAIPIKNDGEQRIKSYIVRMCRLYLVWTLIYLPLTVYGFYIDRVPSLKAFAVFIRNILLVGENYMSWPLWYLLALIVAITIIYGLLKLKMSKNIIVAISIFVALIGVGLEYCKECDTILHPITDIYFSVFQKTRNGFFVGFLFVALGMLCAKLEQISYVVLIILGVIGVGGMILNIPLSYAFVVFVIYVLSLSANVDTISNSTAFNLRKMSTIIYFIHMIVIAFLGIFIGVNDGFLLFVLTLVLSIIISITLLYRTKSRVFKFFFD